MLYVHNEELDKTEEPFNICFCHQQYEIKKKKQANSKQCPKLSEITLMYSTYVHFIAPKDAYMPERLEVG